MKRGKDLLKAPPVNESGDLRKGILREPLVDEFFTMVNWVLFFLYMA